MDKLYLVISSKDGKRTLHNSFINRGDALRCCRILAEQGEYDSVDIEELAVQYVKFCNPSKQSTERKEKMDIVEKRSETIAKIIRENADTTLDKEMLLAEMINDEILRDDITYSQKLQIIRRVTELVENQVPLTKEERFKNVWEYKGWFSIRTINLDTGKSEIAWKKDELERYCKTYGVTLEEFVNWKLGIDLVN